MGKSTVRNHFNFSSSDFALLESIFGNQYLVSHCSNHFQAMLPDSFINILLGADDALAETPDTLIPSFIPEDILQYETFDIESIFSDETSLFEQDTTGSKDGDPMPNITGLIRKFGRDAYGCYLPFHYYKDCWGIYLFKEIIEKRVSELYEIFRNEISLKDLKKMYMYAVYRHELFHYHVERFCTKLEIAIKQPVYKNSRVMAELVRGTDEWLEEALAESAVLSSELVKNRTGLKPKLIRKIYEYDLDFMPPGYRDYKCLNFGGPVKAHQVFSGQLIENNLEPKHPPTPLFGVKNEFVSMDKKVPAFLVTGFNKLRRIRM